MAIRSRDFGKTKYPFLHKRNQNLAKGSDSLPIVARDLATLPFATSANNEIT
jgi:hypothetical protein